MNTKLHAVTDTEGRPIRFFMLARQVSDYTGAAALLDSLPRADWFLADRGYDGKCVGMERQQYRSLHFRNWQHRLFALLERPGA